MSNALLSAVNECAEGLDECHLHATCTDTAGSYTCTCISGYRGDGRTCQGNGLLITVARVSRQDAEK